MSDNKKMPVKKQAMFGVEGAYWQGQTTEGDTYFNYSFQKKYKDKDGKWQNTNFFSMLDLCKLLVVILKILLSGVKEYIPQAQQNPKYAPKDAVQGDTPDEDVPF